MSKHKKTPDPDALFGELRSTLQRSEMTSGQRTHIWHMCIRMHRHHPELFAAQWRPYLEGHAPHWRPDLIELHDAKELEKAAHMFPNMAFTLVVDRRLGARSAQIAELLRSPHMSQVSRLYLDEESALVLSAHYLDALEHLQIKSLHTSTLVMLLHLSKTPHRDTLRSLRVEGTYNYSSETAREASRLVPMPELRELDLMGARFTAPGFEALAESAFFDDLERLALSHSPLGIDVLRGLEALCSRNLRELVLREVVLTEEMREILKRSVSFSTLDTLIYDTEA